MRNLRRVFLINLILLGANYKVCATSDLYGDVNLDGKNK